MRLLSVVAVLTATAGLAADPESQPSHGPWRFEASITPVVGQLNDIWTSHLGLGGQLAIAMSPHMRFVVGGLWNHQWVDTGFENKLRLGFESRRLAFENRGPADVNLSLFVPAAVYGGTEFGLLSGQVAAFHFPHRLEFTMAGLVGAVSTRAPMKPESLRVDGSVSPATSADTGVRPTFGFGVGVHFEFFERLSVRLEVRQFAFAQRTTSVNGCDLEDLRAIDNALRAGSPVTAAMTSAGCRVETFDGTDPETGLKRSNDVPIALGLVRNSGSLFQSYLVAQVSVGVTF